ncbi:MAG: MbnP family protein [Chitinophagales bacterium]
MRSVLWLLLFFMGMPVLAQRVLRVNVLPLFGEQPLVEGQVYHLDSGTLAIHQLRFYVSDLQLLRRGKIVFEERKKAHLLDLAEAMDFTVMLKKEVVFDSVRLVLGIDSALHVSGALGGDLDPTRGMYWTWQSGYIHIKMEGNCQGCNTNKEAFQLHLGGYTGATRAAVPMQFSARGDTLNLALHLEQFFAEQPLREGAEVLSPGARAVALAKLFAGCIEPLKP